MNHTNLAKLIIYLGDPPNHLRQHELEEYIWLVEQLLQELRQALLIKKHTPINRPAGSQEQPDRQAPVTRQGLDFCPKIAYGLSKCGSARVMVYLNSSVMVSGTPSR